MQHVKKAALVLGFAAMVFVGLSADAPHAEAGGPYYQPCPPQVIYCNSPCRCCATVKHTIVVCHPCTGCQIPVDLCLPACCTGVPDVYCRGTLLGCGLSRYTWCCGHGARIRYMACGDVKVIYF